MRIYGGKVLAQHGQALALALGVGSPVGLPGLVLAPLSLPSRLCIQTHKAGLMDSGIGKRFVLFLCFFLVLAEHCQNLRPGAHQNHGHYVFPPCLSLQHSIYNFAEASEAYALHLPPAQAWPATHPFTNTSRSWPRGNYTNGMCSHSCSVFSSANIHGAPPM